MKQPDLKKCPFCGGDAEITYGAYDENWWGVRCETCGALVSMPDFGMYDAIEAWNARPGTSMKYEFRYFSCEEDRWHQIFCEGIARVIELVKEHKDAGKIEIVPCVLLEAGA
ncbi:MAG: Lar family restriction alleviation protein [Clostridiaceae bacterium]|nr:Lar family restriction alleviation protein [Clostridiaceae bacterium]